ncbi:MAG: cysteine--tRNA ligase [Chloroflexia bacterium]|nr:cysteine--tRNA ligase [Chloroflexia bacterium]
MQRQNSAPAKVSDLTIYNTLTRVKEPFTSIVPGKIGMYVCGVTVYDSAHIGHGMSSIVFDTIRRYLLHLGYNVRYAQNFTDVDDKIINRAIAEGITPNDLTNRLITEWDEEITAFNVLPATVAPRATNEIPEIISMIEGLIAREHAYETHGDVYFMVRSFPHYGKLSGRDIDELTSGARIAVSDIKDDPLDFVLWKSSKPGEPSWPSPWGTGRPGWHIECSAMCTHHLDGVVDIHGGGRDLIFPHHENEVAQSEAFSGEAPFARFWLHNGMLQLNGEKMSKSLGNVVWLKSLIERGLEQAFRLQVLQTHYRSPLNYTEAGLAASASGLVRLIAAGRPETTVTSNNQLVNGENLILLAEDTDRRFHEAMHDDFDTPSAIAALFELARSINRLRSQSGGTEQFRTAQHTLAELSGLLGLDLTEQHSTEVGAADPFIDLLIDIRAHLRQAKQWDAADRVRLGLQEQGIALEDNPSGTTWKKI